MTDTSNSKRKYVKNIFVQEEELCELWQNEQIEALPHSRLFHLEPIGMGTPFVESLTSYITRLAEAHSTDVRTLVSHEIAPHLEHSYLSGSLDKKGHASSQVIASFWQESTLINGLTSGTEDWIRVLEQLTLRQDLRFLTMISWKRVFSSRYLMHQTQRWCPICYEEWISNGLIVYQPLLWTLQSTYLCLLHNIPLQQQCPYANCNHKLPLLSSKFQIGYCPKCNRWLGGSEQKLSDKQLGLTDIEKQQYQPITQAMGELLASAPNLTVLPSQDVFSQTLTAYIKRIGSMAKFTQHYQIGKNCVREWARALRLPQHTSFLKMCLSLKASPLNWLTGNAMEITTSIEESPPDTSTSKRQVKQNIDYESTKNALETALRSEQNPFPSVKEITKNLGYSRTSLVQKFPDLCKAISARYYNELKKEKAASFQKKLEAVLQSQEIISMQQVAKKLGCHPSYLSQKFPDLCKAISARYLEERRRKRVERAEKNCEEIRQVVYYLHEQGIYPSGKKLRQGLTNPSIMKEEVCRIIWKKTLQELGWR